MVVIRAQACQPGSWQTQGSTSTAITKPRVPKISKTSKLKVLSKFATDRWCLEDNRLGSQRVCPGDAKASVVNASREARAKLTEQNQGSCHNENPLMKVVLRCVKSSGKAENAADYT